MAAKVNPAYYQHNVRPSGKAMVAYVNPAYFQPGYAHHEVNPLHGSKGRKKGVTKHGAAGVHGAQHIHESPMPGYRDPFGHKGMGKVRGR